MEFAPRKIATTRGEVTLRMAASADVAAFSDLRLAALRLSPESFGMAYEDVAGRTLDEWRAQFDRPGVIAVVEAGDELVAMAGLAPQQGRKYVHKAIIWGVFVRPDWRGLGLARPMLETLLEVARAQPNLRKVELSVVTTNARALRLYEALGFRIYGTAPEELFVNGAYYDEHLMVLKLRS